MKKTITVDIDPDGNASIDLDGFQGQGCSKVMADFVGKDKVLKAVNKREYSIQTSATQKLTSGR